MITQPSIDKLIEIAGCKYSLCTIISKRARVLNDLLPQGVEHTLIKPITQAANELYENKIQFTND